MEDLIAKPKRAKGRPRKNFDTTKTFEWFDEADYQRALQDRKMWDEAFESVKILTDTEFENLQDFEADLRTKYPDLKALEIEQLYILAKLDRQAIKSVYRDLSGVSKVPIDKETYTVRIPSENALEYSQYLAIVQAFTELRKDNNKINIMMLPQITNSKIVFDIRTGALRVNAYRFTKDYK